MRTGRVNEALGSRPAWPAHHRDRRHRQRLHRRDCRARCVKPARSMPAASRRRRHPHRWRFGVPYAVKNLSLTKALTTLAGLNRARPAARVAATVRWCAAAAGAVWSARSTWTSTRTASPPRTATTARTRNPHDPCAHRRGSSSAARAPRGGWPGATDAGLGHQRLHPRALVCCAASSASPTFGLPRWAATPCPSIDHLGPLARNVQDLACADAMQGHDAHDLGCGAPYRAHGPELERGLEGLRIGHAWRLLHDNAGPRLRGGPRAARALDQIEMVELPEVACARAAAFVISNRGRQPCT